MQHIALSHDKLAWIRTHIDFARINSVKELVSTITEAATQFQDEEEVKQFKGDAFEIFVEYFMKYFEGHNDIGITQYQPAQALEDLGVDGEGSGHDKKPATVQVKFRSNPKKNITHEELAKFLAQSILQYGVDPADLRNMLVVSTAFDTTSNVQALYLSRGMRHIGYNDLERIIGLINPDFWEGLNWAVKRSQAPLVRTRKPRFEHQKEANEAIRDFLHSPQKRGYVISGTGSGKTLMEGDTAKEYFIGGGKVVVYASPRISLTEQSKVEIHCNSEGISFERLTFDSCGLEQMPEIAGEAYERKRSTTNPVKAKQFIGEALNRDAKVFIFTTLHSTLKLFEVLKELGINDFLYMADECHNLVPPEFSNILASDSHLDKFLGFTGTGRYTPRNPNGTGMNNPTRWGKLIIGIPYCRLASEGITLPPRAFYLIIDDNEDPDALNVDIVNKGIRAFKDQVYPEQPCKVIVTCSSVREAHHMADSDVLTDLPDFQKFVITSDLEKMRGRKKEEQLRGFAQAENAVIFHYDMIGEGTNVPSTSSTLPLRAMSPIKAFQTISRANRVLESDRGKPVDDRQVWDKPWAWVICPYIRKNPQSAHAYINMNHILYEMRKQDPNFMIEAYTFVADSSGEEDDHNVEPYSKRVKEISDKVIQDLEILQEEEEKALAIITKAGAQGLVGAELVLTDSDIIQLSRIEESNDSLSF